MIVRPFMRSSFWFSRYSSIVMNVNLSLLGVYFLTQCAAVITKCEEIIDPEQKLSSLCGPSCFLMWWSDTIKPHSFSGGENQWSSMDLKYTFQKNLPKFVTWLPFRILLSIAITEWRTKQSKKMIWTRIFSLSNQNFLQFQIMKFSKLISMTFKKVLW